MKEEKIKNFKAAFLNKMNKHKILTLIFGWIIILYAADFAANFYNSIFIGDCAYYGKYEDVEHLINFDGKSPAAADEDEVFNVKRKLESISPVYFNGRLGRYFLTKTDDKCFMFYTLQTGENTSKHKVTIEFYNPINNSLVQVPLETKPERFQEIEGIWLGDNKFIIVYESYNSVIMYIYQINNDGSIKEIARSKAEKIYQRGHIFAPKFNYKAHLTINSQTVLFPSTRIRELPFKLSRTFYLYNYKTNKLLRLEDCFFASRFGVAARIDDYSFLVCTHSIFFKNKRVYVYTINRKAVKAD